MFLSDVYDKQSLRLSLFQNILADHEMFQIIL